MSIGIKSWPRRIVCCDWLRRSSPGNLSRLISKYNFYSLITDASINSLNAARTSILHCLLRSKSEVQQRDPLSSMHRPRRCFELPTRGRSCARSAPHRRFSKCQPDV